MSQTYPAFFGLFFNSSLCLERPYLLFTCKGFIHHPWISRSNLLWDQLCSPTLPHFCMTSSLLLCSCNNTNLFYLWLQVLLSNRGETTPIYLTARVRILGRSAGSCAQALTRLKSKHQLRLWPHPKCEVSYWLTSSWQISVLFGCRLQICFLAGF